MSRPSYILSSGNRGYKVLFPRPKLISLDLPYHFIVSAHVNKRMKFNKTFEFWKLGLNFRDVVEGIWSPSSNLLFFHFYSYISICVCIYMSVCVWVCVCVYKLRLDPLRRSQSNPSLKIIQCLQKKLYMIRGTTNKVSVIEYLWGSSQLSSTSIRVKCLPRWLYVTSRSSNQFLCEHNTTVTFNV